MKRQDFTDEQLLQALEDAGGIKDRAADALGVGRTSYRRWLDRLNGDYAGSSNQSFRSTQSGESWIIESNSDRIETVDDALRKAQVDTTIWEVDRVVVNGWDVTAKLSNGTTEQLTTKQNYQLKVWLRRKVPKSIADACVELMDRMKKHSPSYRAVRYKGGGDYLLVVSPFDLHFGLLAWEPETGTDWDCDIAETVFVNAIEQILDKIQPYKVAEILFPLGQDFFHVDTAKGETIHGTPLGDTDSRYAKMFRAGVMACVKVIDRMRLIAPVRVVWVPGNHDRTTSYHLAMLLDAWYRKTKTVEVDCSPKARKYHQFGVNLIGSTHGDEEKHQTLPAIMAAEVPALWASTTYREWLIGHLHKARQVRYIASDTHVGVSVHVCPSLCGTDYWHYIKGYVNKVRTMEGSLYHRTNGLFARFSVAADDKKT